MRYPLNENRETWTADKGKGGRKAGNKSKLWVCVAIVFLVLIAVLIIGVLSGRKNDQSLKQILSAEVSEETVQPAEQKATAAAPKEDDKPNGQKATAAAVADKYYGQYKVSDWKLITTAEETLSYVNLAESFTTEEQRRVNVFLGTSLNRVCC